MCAALDGERCADSGELRAELQRADRELIHVDVRQAGAGSSCEGSLTGARSIVESRQRADSRPARAVRRSASGDQRSAMRSAVSQTPCASLSCSCCKVDGRRKGAREAREAHVAVRQPGGHVLDQPPPARGVAGDEDGGDEHHDEQQQRADGPGGDLAARDASEGLPEADVDLEAIVVAATIGRHRKVEPQRTDRRVVARADADARLPSRSSCLAGCVLELQLRAV